MYLLFGGDPYYPGGGLKDFKQSFETIEKARAAVFKLDAGEDWAHIGNECGVILETYSCHFNGNTPIWEKR